MYVIRPLTAGDAGLLRDLRLRALRDSPDAFGPTHAEALAEPEAYWLGWAAGREGRVQAFAAFDAAGVPCGLVSGGRQDGHTGGFGALWVARSARGTGLGRDLVLHVCGWLAGLGCTRILLSVTDGNAAERLYESLGFVRTGERHRLRPGSPLSEVTMVREPS